VRRAASEALPAAVTVRCPACGRTVTTTQSGNTTRCPVRAGGCGTAIPVPAGLTRPPVRLACGGCGHVWATRAKGGGVIRCPACSKARRVPVSLRADAEAWQQQPRPRRRRQDVAPRPPRRVSPVPLGRQLGALLGGGHQAAEVPPRPRPAAAGKGERRPIGCAACGHTWHTRAKAGSTLRCPSCGYARRVPGERPRQDAPAPRRAAPAPLRTAPADPAAAAEWERREYARRERVCMVTGTLGGRFRVWFTPHDGCEVLDCLLPTAQQDCPAPLAVVVEFTDAYGGESAAYACAEHGPALAAQAAGALHVAVEVRPLRR